jgi:hypothetical protein
MFSRGAKYFATLEDVKNRMKIPWNGTCDLE